MIEARREAVNVGRAACPDCGGTLIDDDDYSACEFIDDLPGGDWVGVVGCGFDTSTCERCGWDSWGGVCGCGTEAVENRLAGGGPECVHGLAVRWCSACLGRWDGVVRSGVTGAVISGPDLVAWFVPSVGAVRQPDHPRAAADKRQRSGNGCPSDRLGGVEVGGIEVGLLSDPAVSSVEVGDEVGPPAWYRGGTVGVRSVGAACDTLGLDWYGMSEAYAAELLLSLLPSGVAAPVPILSGLTSAESSAAYVRCGLWPEWEDTKANLREWRQLTGRTEGAAAAWGVGS